VSLRDFEREEDRAALPRPRTPEYDDQGHESTDGLPPSRPWGFFLVLAAIVVIAIVYSVTMFAIDPRVRTPETAFGAMAAAFSVIGTLVGTYFGIKAGLDGQDKVKETVSRTIRGGAVPPRGRTRREDE
jgi:hypothetical protein